jgi:hypothetical protein
MPEGDFETIAAMWEGYRSHCVPKDAGPEQVSQTRQAFYAGATVILAEVDMMSKCPDHMEQTWAGYMGRLIEESVAFIRSNI